MTWQKTFEEDFKTRKFGGMSLEDTTKEAVEYFISYFTTQIEIAEERGYGEGYIARAKEYENNKTAREIFNKL